MLIFGDAAGANDVRVAQLVGCGKFSRDQHLGISAAAAERVAPAERLAYFAKFLQHADPIVAEDAYLEFGHARFDEVATVADRLSMDQLRAWIVSEPCRRIAKVFMVLP